MMTSDSPSKIDSEGRLLLYDDDEDYDDDDDDDNDDEVWLVLNSIYGLRKVQCR